MENLNFTNSSSLSEDDADTEECDDSFGHPGNSTSEPFEIVDKAFNNGELEYLFKWGGKYYSWENKEDLSFCEDLIEDFEKKLLLESQNEEEDNGDEEDEEDCVGDFKKFENTLDTRAYNSEPHYVLKLKDFSEERLKCDLGDEDDADVTKSLWAEDSEKRKENGKGCSKDPAEVHDEQEEASKVDPKDSYDSEVIVELDCFDIGKVLAGKRLPHGKLQYLLQWMDFDCCEPNEPEKISWEFEEYLIDLGLSTDSEISCLIKEDMDVENTLQVEEDERLGRKSGQILEVKN